LPTPLRFIDLFAGLGGFHQALGAIGHECVFACEIDPDLAALYEKNFGIEPLADIRDHYRKVPPHDILCAGFPCQPFSKAGDQLGFDCPQWGDLFEYVVKILKRHKPRYLLIENVPNLLRHDEGRTWEKVCDTLRDAGYAIEFSRLSPHMFGVPQIRERALIVGDRQGLSNFKWPAPTHEPDDISITSALDHQPLGARSLTPAAIKYLEAWQALLAKLPYDAPLPSFPIWAMEFGATYPLEGPPPARRAAGAFLHTRGPIKGSLNGKSSLSSKIARSIGNIERSSMRGCRPFVILRLAFRSSNGIGKAARAIFGRPSFSFAHRAYVPNVRTPRHRLLRSRRAKSPSSRGNAAT
jgi:DNA (cytosine-5)-methyltransferase 1